MQAVKGLCFILPFNLVVLESQVILSGNVHRAAWQLFTISNDKHIVKALPGSGVPPNNGGGVFRIQLHEEGDAIQLLRGHERGTGAAEQIQHDAVLHGGHAHRVSDQWQGLCGRMSDVKAFLSAERIRYRQEVWSSKDETVPNPWTLLIIDNVMTLFFAKNDKLFKIVFWPSYEGKLPNGIHTGMGVEEAKKLDPDLVFDDWNEDYESPEGYWFEDDIDTKTVDSISVFIKEILDEDRFDYCEW